ncbi:MAG: AAA domain-containing protein [Planctomycetota bacterium]|nr:AAA domain-containing protein [Planctomycetota bacterium]
MQLTLEQRLLRFLVREERDEQRANRELRAQPTEHRVLEGECIEAARFLREDDGRWVFHVEDNSSKFRAGDPLLVGDGLDLDGALSLSYGSYDAQTAELVCELDPFRRDVEPQFEAGAEYVLDRRSLGIRGRLRDAVRGTFANKRLTDVLSGSHQVRVDDGRQERARAALADSELNDGQVEAGALAIGTESLALIQGPPGTGKTRLLAAVVAALCGKTCRVALCAYTHRAVDNALLAIRKLAPDLPLYKLSSSSSDGKQQLRAAGVYAADARRGRFPERGCVVAGTCYQLAKLHERERFHYTVFDEAGQLPIPHALPGMLRSDRWLFFGDHRQLPPVVTTGEADRGASMSIFEHLHEHYGSALLDTTYRMNEGVCRIVSETFYDGLLRSADSVAGRRMPFEAGGRLDEVLTPDEPVVWLRLDHRQPGQRSTEEANAVADLVEDLVRRHGVAPEEIAVIAPFRAQVRLMQSAIDKKALNGAERLTVETVERIQGQEREVVIVSLAAGDPAESKKRGAFHLSLNRLNVALSRARSKAVLVGSSHAFKALPPDAAGLRMASRCKELRDRMTCVDMTKLYVVAHEARRGE